MTSRRAALLSLAGGAALLLAAAGAAWGTAQVEGSALLPTTPQPVRGAAVAPTVLAAGWLAAASLLALLAGGRWVRRGVGAALVVVGVLVVATVVPALSDPVAAVAAVAEPDAAVTARGLWPVLAVAAGVDLVVVGVLALLHGGRWQGMSRRYERPDGVASPEPSDLWRRLDRGEDPTTDDGGGRA
jgi:hypothetical protein